VVDGARERREAIRQLADLRRRLAAAEEALAGAHAASKHAEEALDAASDRFDDAERAFDAAREDRAQARRERYAARQAYERAAAADRLQRRVTEPSDRLGRTAELTSTAPRRGGRWPGGAWLPTSPRRAPYSHQNETFTTNSAPPLLRLDKCSNRVGGSAVACLVALPRAVRERARVGAWPGAGVLEAVLMPRRPDAAPGPGHLGALHGRLPAPGCRSLWYDPPHRL
jgi:multidrug efflux pump subunit AcrA (membrane-fusion protein)